jgi:undecaprenyl-diphosphatase
MKARIIGLMAIVLFISFFLDEPVARFFLLLQNPLLDIIMEWLSHELTLFIVLIVISCLFLYQERKTKFIPVLFVTFIAAFAISLLLKLTFMRLRPIGFSQNSLSMFGLSLLLPDYSFPSSHTTTAFSVLPVLDKEFRKLRGFWIVFAVLIAVSRIYLNQHHLSDIVAGIIIGYMIGHYILKIEHKHGIAKFFRHT